ncbi:unnamed protein product [Linum tenue]|uniref:Solute carrier family 40 member n=1 Tax=Linum tenue TaxID=586396 RepID=A0AAV0KPG2_9ROSI|nr:unnamed protein product [Linum tenue]
MSSALFIAVACYQCSTVQVKQQKKSSNKWTCVVCNEKQSVRKVFFQSYVAKDVRQFVQSRNMARKIADEQASSLERGELIQEQPLTMVPASSFCIRAESKRRYDWSEYLDPAEDNSEQQETVEEGEVEVITEMPPKRAKFRNGERLPNQMKQTNKEQVKESQGASLKYEASKLADPSRRNATNLLCNKEETMVRQLSTTAAATTATAKASKWDDYLTNDEDEWMWEFCVGLYMINLWPGSLILAAVYGAVESASIALFGPLVGQLIDGLTYVQILRLWLVTQNLSFIVAGATVIALLLSATLKFTNFTAFISLVALANASGAIGTLSTLVGTILIEREWVVVISEGHPPGVLTEMNSTIRRIDLTCKLLAPVASGFIISFVSLKASAITLACWNTVAIWLEYFLFMSVYKGIPALGESNLKRVSRFPPAGDVEESTTTPFISPENVSSISHGEAPFNVINDGWRREMDEWLSKAPFIGAWRVYMRQSVVLPGVALALLFFTVLSFGTLMTATLEWEGIPAYVIGLGRGVSAIIGISATFVYPVMQSQISTLRTGLWSIWSQWGCLLVCVGAIWIQSRTLSAYILMAGVALSRIGLWMFDLSVIQQMQDFWKLTLISVAAVTLAAILYSIHIYRVRKHLIHFEKLIVWARWAIRLAKRIYSSARVFLQLYACGIEG